MRAERFLRASLAGALPLAVLALLSLQGTKDGLVFAMNGVTALGFVAVALLALAQRDGGPRPRLWLLFGFTASAALEIALPFYPEGRPVLGAVAVSAYYPLTGWQIGVQLHLASLIPERASWLRSRPWIVPLYYAAGLGIGAASCATYVIQTVFGRRVFPWSMDGVDRLLQGTVLPLWALAVTLLLTAQALRHPEPRGRQQAGLVLAATIPWLLFTVVSSVLERSGFTLPEWTGPLETLILLGYPVAFFAALFRYHLFDVELAARRGLLYTTLTGALMLVFYAALGAGSALFSHLLEGRESVGSVAGATLLLGLVFAPLRRALQRMIDRRVFPERQALRRRLADLAGELPALGKLPRMGSHLVERLTSIFLVRSAALLIAEPETGLLRVLASTPDGIDPAFLLALDDPAIEDLRRAGRPMASSGLAPDGLLVPLLHQERLTGVLMVGRKEGSRAWPAEELDLLSLLAHHVAIVLENARLFESATYEGLTGLLRREAILEQLGRELERALRHGRPLAVAIADLDHFKGINDRHGHLAGDALLRRTAQVIAGELRGTDAVGRYGGEEFLLVLPETDLQGAAAVAEKVRRRVQETRVMVEDGMPRIYVTATVSIGLAVLGVEGSLTSRDLIAAADRALYEAKSAGRNRVRATQNAMISPTLPSPWNSPSPES
ncbi:MAG TPA: sensor domain-containing diguanylate cyclase [Thermoanaerobaculia bacterium]|nr:sensor domain-containing diguanylate cyclase [Thermoanaerobaculia bacterium]